MIVLRKRRTFFSVVKKVLNVRGSAKKHLLQMEGKIVIHFWWVFQVFGRRTYRGFKGTQEWEIVWLRFWILYYFIVIYVKILRFCKKNFLIGPVLEEVRFFRVVLGLRGMKKIFELGQKNIFLFFYLWTLYMS